MTVYVCMQMCDSFTLDKQPTIFISHVTASETKARDWVAGRPLNVYRTYEECQLEDHD